MKPPCYAAKPAAKLEIITALRKQGRLGGPLPLLPCNYCTAAPSLSCITYRSLCTIFLVPLFASLIRLFVGVNTAIYTQTISSNMLQDH